jgi:hypothetical protein
MVTELCWRCGAEMDWRHAAWQCGICRFKLGCCEGEPQNGSRGGDHDRRAQLDLVEEPVRVRDQHADAAV